MYVVYIKFKMFDNRMVFCVGLYMFQNSCEYYNGVQFNMSLSQGFGCILGYIYGEECIFFVYDIYKDLCLVGLNKVFFVDYYINEQYLINFCC